MCHTRTLPAVNLSKKTSWKKFLRLSAQPVYNLHCLVLFHKTTQECPTVHNRSGHLSEQLDGTLSLPFMECVCGILHSCSLSNLVFFFFLKEHLSQYCSHLPHAWLRIQIKPWYYFWRKRTLAFLRFKGKVWFGHRSSIVWKCDSGASATRS